MPLEAAFFSRFFRLGQNGVQKQVVRVFVLWRQQKDAVFASVLRPAPIGFRVERIPDCFFVLQRIRIKGDLPKGLLNGQRFSFRHRVKSRMIDFADAGELLLRVAEIPQM